MLADFRELESGGTLEADICVIGAGAAGITLASELTDGRQSVIVLESGGLEFDPEVQNLYDGTNVRQYFSLTTSRFRLFGGTTYGAPPTGRIIVDSAFQCSLPPDSPCLPA